MSKRNLFGVSMLGGIGFTVALFIANLSFDGSTAAGADLLNQAKLGVFTGSFIFRSLRLSGIEMGFT